MAKKLISDEPQHCLHEEQWGRILKIAERHEHDLYGNGNKGMRDVVTELSFQVGALVDISQKQNDKLESTCSNIGDLKTSVNAMMMAQEDFDKWREDKKQKEEKKVDTKIKIFSIILATIMAIFTIVNGVVSYSKNIKPKEQTEYESSAVHK